MNSDYENIRMYLLGGLSEAEREGIDLRIIEDEDFAVEALAVEDLLIEEYIDGQLTGTEAADFHANYLTTEERARRVRELAAVRTAARRASAEPDQTVMPETERGGWSFSSVLLGFRPAVAIAAMALIIVAVVGIWIYLSNGSSLEREYAALNRGDMSDLGRLRSYSAVELVPGTFRGGDTASRIATASLTETILFRLPLTFDVSADARFRAELMREREPVFSVDDLKPVREGGMTEVRVLLPRELIGKGQYQIRLTQAGSQSAPVLFGFTAE